MKKILAGIWILIFLASCDKREEEVTSPTSFTSIATVDNPNQNSGFYFKLDNNDKMWIAETNFPYYHPKTGQRIIANYSILSVNSNGSTYDHKVSLNDVYEVLTKNIFKIKPSTQDSIGNDQIEIRDLWIGSNYLNVEFVYPGYNKIHYINLVSDSLKTYTDGKIHLEFRHNANNDNPIYSRWGVVSFDLHSLQATATADSLNLVIHTKEFTTPVDKVYNLTYKFGNAALAQTVKRVSMPQNAGRLN